VLYERKLKIDLQRDSVGIEVTRECLFNFSKCFARMYDLKIEDLFDHQNKASGTKVILNIPI